MNFRLQITAALTFTLLMFGWAPAEPIQFQSLPTNPAVTTMSLSEDGRFLIVAHEMANQISIWDAQTAKHIKVIATPRPSFVLSRSKRVYVANNTKGTISLFAIDKDWEFTDQLQVGQNNIRSLSAPLGKNFEGVIFATCPEDQPSPKAQIVAIDTVKDRSAPIFPPAACEAVTVDSLGRFFVQQIPFDYSPSGKVDRALDLKMALAGRRKEIGGRPDHREAPYLRPFGPTGLWFGGNVVFGGMPPNSSQKTWGNVVLPDLLMPMFYAIGDT
ncbi:MAG: hypothetical protein IH991_13610, partial [Planctomycetes bacterium]|nr:hypothetical protein [Planctomycetota bacterium]